jgi:exopolyphosphatase/guanosine-5'-triphosphate,3'-diphosphate pyrophosphatase
MSRFAAIDLGTNSCRLLIAEPDGNGLRIVHDWVEVVGLGRGVDAHGHLQAGVVATVVEVLVDFAARCRLYGVQTIAAVGTSALRDAVDRQVFLDRVRAAAGFSMAVIDGHEEARLSFLAAARSVGAMATGGFVAVDFGGGSTEFIYGQGERIDHALSLDIGSRRMLERFLRSDPPTGVEWLEMCRHLDQAVQAVPVPPTATSVIGIGGTVIHLSRLIHGGDGLERFDAADLAPISERVRTTPMAQRRSFIGLDPRRADVIVAGCGLVAAVLSRFQRPIIPTPWGLRHGLFLDRFGR